MSRIALNPARLAVLAAVLAAAGVAVTFAPGAAMAERQWLATARCDDAGASGAAISSASPEEALARAVRVCTIAGGDPEHCRASARIEPDRAPTVAAAETTSARI